MAKMGFQANANDLTSIIILLFIGQLLCYFVQANSIFPYNQRSTCLKLVTNGMFNGKLNSKLHGDPLS